MQQAVREASTEYWQPANLEASRVIKPLTAKNLCPNCQTEYTIGARFCHVCGEECRSPRLEPTRHEPEQSLPRDLLRQGLGLSIPSVIFFLLGIACLAGALLTGFFYRGTTLLDLEAVHAWRIDWLLAAIAAMLAGILLKKKAA